MTFEDRDLLQALRRQQAELQQSLHRIEHDLQTLEIRAQAALAGGEAVAVSLPQTNGTLPPLPFEAFELPPLPTDHLPLPPIPPSARTLPPVPSRSIEFHLGSWLPALGALFGVVFLILALSLSHQYLFTHLGPSGILGLSGLVCMLLVVADQRLERKQPRGRVFARGLLGLGLAGLYLTLYAAHSLPATQVIAGNWIEGALLLLWSVYVLQMANRLRSQSLAFFAIALAYLSTAIDPLGRFSLIVELFLAGTSFVLLLHRGWASLPFVSLIAVYVALLRRLIFDGEGHLVLDTSRALPFLPYAVYLLAAWGIFTAAVLLARSPSFRGERRAFFLSCNNGALAVLLTLTTYLSGYGAGAMGATLFWVGVLYLLTALYAGGQRPDATFGEVSGAYLGQGIAVVTLGLMGLFTGVTRSVILTLETFFLGVVGGYSRHPILKAAAAIVAFFASFFIIWEISLRGHRPWLLGVGGMAVLLSNAWWARRAERASPLGFRALVPSSIYYCVLALAVISTALLVQCTNAELPPWLAFYAVGLTFLVYLFSIYELPPLAQVLMLAAQALVLYPLENGEAMPWGSTLIVALLTLVLLAWWPRQRITRRGPWTFTIGYLYALVLAGLAYHALRPELSYPWWMVTAGLLACAFLALGALMEVGPLAAVGPLFLLVCVLHFFLPAGAFTPFAWSWPFALAPVGIVFVIGRSLQHWLRETPEVKGGARTALRGCAYACEILALVMVIRLLAGLVPENVQLGIFLFLSTFLLLWNLRPGGAFGVRCSLVLTAAGLILLVVQLASNPQRVVHPLNALGLLGLFLQPALMRLSGRRVVTEAESWLLILASSAAGWLFVSAWIMVRGTSAYLSMGWAFYALFLFLLGLLSRERRLRWCGVGVLIATILRVPLVDLWGRSNGVTVLTLAVLAAITLGLGYIYARHSDRLKSLL